MRSRTREWRCMDTPHAVEARCVASRARNGHRTAVRLHRVPAEVATAHAPLRSTVQHREYVPVVQHRDTAHKQTHVAKLRHSRSNRVAIPHRR
jgi:hypothetical protein